MSSIGGATWLGSQEHTTKVQRQTLLETVCANGHSTAEADAAAKVQRDIIDLQKFSIDLVHSIDLECASPPTKRGTALMEKRNLMHPITRYGF